MGSGVKLRTPTGHRRIKEIEDVLSGEVIRLLARVRSLEAEIEIVPECIRSTGTWMKKRSRSWAAG